ncbi:unnamed protein product [Rotaria sordida]|uniref:Uncharacterized protein n=1 Tax=Rotaria sordida TaxID=392033 RepID=A0A815QIX7_9BILA|nr:unnamed protein product [Rotaria sordida]CAF3815732.1 unnamed protein product [Rotaria sordida]
MPSGGIHVYVISTVFLNKVLRTQDFDMLFILRFFITDLSKQLNNEYDCCLREMPTRGIIRVYHGVPAEHQDLLATYNRFVITYSTMYEVQMTFEYYNRCLNIRLATLCHDHPDIATSYIIISNGYTTNV